MNSKQGDNYTWISEISEQPTFFLHLFKCWKSTACVHISQHLTDLCCSPNKVISNQLVSHGDRRKLNVFVKAGSRTDFADCARAFRVSFFDLASCILLSKSYITRTPKKLISCYPHKFSVRTSEANASACQGGKTSCLFSSKPLWAIMHQCFKKMPHLLLLMLTTVSRWWDITETFSLNTITYYLQKLWQYITDIIYEKVPQGYFKGIAIALPTKEH